MIVSYYYLYLSKQKRNTMNHTHEQLAKLWLNYNGQSGTTKQIEKTVKQLTADTLLRMLQARKVI